MDIFADPALKLSVAGKLRQRHANEISVSPLGIGFETLDREMFIPEKCYDFVAAAGEMGTLPDRLEPLRIEQRSL